MRFSWSRGERLGLTWGPRFGAALLRSVDALALIWRYLKRFFGVGGGSGGLLPVEV